MHTIASLKEGSALDITHAAGVEKLDKEEREVILHFASSISSLLNMPCPSIEIAYTGDCMASYIRHCKLTPVEFIGQEGVT